LPESVYYLSTPAASSNSSITRLTTYNQKAPFSGALICAEIDEFLADGHYFIETLSTSRRLDSGEPKGISIFPYSLSS
jgi:hypothetical protein